MSRDPVPNVEQSLAYLNDLLDHIADSLRALAMCPIMDPAAQHCRLLVNHDGFHEFGATS